MKKLLVIALAAFLMFGCASFDKKQDTTSDLERLAEGAEGKWSDYGDMGDGVVATGDTLMIRDIDDPTLSAATGTQKEYQWGDVVLDMSKLDCEDLADDTYQGRTVVYDCGEAANCAVGDIVFVDPADADPLKEADADVVGEFPARGIVVVAGNDTAPTVILIEGCIRDDSEYAWTITAPTDFIYLGKTPGTATQTVPAVSGDCIQIIGYPIEADIAFYDFGRPYLNVE